MVTLRFVVAAAAALTAAACAGSSRANLDLVPDTTPSPVRVVTETVTVRDREMAQRLSRLELQVYDKDAQIEELQARLDEARRDVVRSLAKVQTLATRAEAASAMAEAEVALETLRRTSGGRGPEVARTAKMLQDATNEFNHQNYGGALWLSNQAKGQAGLGRARYAAADSAELVDGESLFAVPLRFETVRRTNLRDGPGTSYRAVATLEAGTSLTAYSYVDEWVRVADGNGHAGWVYYGLVRRRTVTAN